MLAQTALLVLAVLPGVLAAPTVNGTAVEALPCGAFEELTCGSPCTKTCTNPNPVCEGACVPNTCQCIEGYSRDLKTGTCKLEDDCIRSPALACRQSAALCKQQGGLLNCKDGLKCINECSVGLVDFLQDDTNTIYCKGESNEFVACSTVDCIKNDICGANEIWRDCGPCDQVCGDLAPICEKECPEACVCLDGFSRDENGNCVEKCCARISCNDQAPCPADTIEIKTTGEIVDGCKTTCDEVVCVPKFLEDGSPCGGEMMHIPGFEELQCKAPSNCLTHDFAYLPLGGPRVADAPAVCGRYGARIVGAVYLQHLATNGVRVCDLACERNDKCVAWQYMHRGAGRYGYCAILSGYNEGYPYFSFWWYTAHYVSAIKR